MKKFLRVLGWSVVVGNPFTDLDPVDVFGAIFQYPGTHGQAHDFGGTEGLLIEIDGVGSLLDAEIRGNAVIPLGNGFDAHDPSPCCFR